MKAFLAHTMVACAFLWLPSEAGAQCNFEFREHDEFTKAYRVRASVKVALNSTARLWWKPTRVDDLYYLRVELTSMPYSMVVGVDDPLMLMLDDGTVLELLPNDVYASSYQSSYAGSNYYTMGINYQASRSLFEQLAIAHVHKIRVYASDAYSDYDISGKGKPEKLTAVMRCVIQARP